MEIPKNNLLGLDSGFHDEFQSPPRTIAMSSKSLIDSQHVTLSSSNLRLVFLSPSRMAGQRDETVSPFITSKDDHAPPSYEDIYPCPKCQELEGLVARYEQVLTGLEAAATKPRLEKGKGRKSAKAIITKARGFLKKMAVELQQWVRAAFCYSSSNSFYWVLNICLRWATRNYEVFTKYCPDDDYYPTQSRPRNHRPSRRRYIRPGDDSVYYESDSSRYNPREDFTCPALYQGHVYFYNRDRSSC